MKRKNIVAAFILTMPIGMAAQSAIDAYNLTPTELRGTARFVGMGGAFTSLGGDLSTMTQNPAGLGVYRRSEIGTSFDVSIQKYNTATQSNAIKLDQTKVLFDNFGYIGAYNFDSGALRTFSWGFGYNRITNFQRLMSGYNASTATSLSNYIAAYTNGINSDAIGFADGYNPYQNSGEDWLSILAYNSYMINNNPGTKDSYSGLYNGQTQGDALYKMRESGYVDEYNIQFGGNVSDVFYWGLGVGIQDLNYTREILYSESMADATIYSTKTSGLVKGNAGFDLDNLKTISGTGANIKFGVIIRPIDFLRVGAAIHTPTWFHLNHQGDAVLNYSYYNPSQPEDRDNPLSGEEHTDWFDYDSRLTTPWRFMVGASAVIGQTAIVSVDYERVAYNDMSVKRQNYDGYFGSSFVSDDNVNSDIKTYYQAANIVRAGLELRVVPQFSIRAGYNVQSSNVRSGASDGQAEIFTSGTDPSYSFNKTTQNICFGVGYRYKAWYLDLTYQWRHRTSDFHAYTDFNGQSAPTARLTENHHNLIFSTGFKF